MQKKKLDNLFQEKFLDFKEVPDNKVWRAIDASLDKKKKKRIIPIWLRLSGVAAALAIAFLLFDTFSESQIKNQILLDIQKEVQNNIDLQPESAPNFEGTDIDRTKPFVEINQESKLKSLEKQLVSSKKQGKTPRSTQRENVHSNSHQSVNKDALAQNNSGRTEKSNTDNPLTTVEGKNPDATQITIMDSAIINKRNGTPLKEETVVAAHEVIKTDEKTAVIPKKSIFDEITEQDEEIAQNTTVNRWSAGPSIAPVYFNAMGQGSSVNPIFIPNSRSGNINLSYGVSVAYNISKKLTIRSGIHKVDFGYDTEDVTFSSSLNTISSNGQLATIDYAPTSETLIVSSKKVASDKFSTANSALDVSAKSATRDGYMSQQLGYIELPFELNYALLDKKFGINMIGGISSLFLIDNIVSLTAGELTTEIGEANNLNNINFSANLGIGLNYRFSPRIRFNLEPIFKYQLHTFSEIDGTFRPYSIGVYSGLSFKF